MVCWRAAFVPLPRKGWTERLSSHSQGNVRHGGPRLNLRLHPFLTLLGGSSRFQSSTNNALARILGTTSPTLHSCISLNGPFAACFEDRSRSRRRARELIDTQELCRARRPRSEGVQSGRAAGQWFPFLSSVPNPGSASSCSVPSPALHAVAAVPIRASGPTWIPTG